MGNSRKKGQTPFAGLTPGEAKKLLMHFDQAVDKMWIDSLDKYLDNPPSEQDIEDKIRELIAIKNKKKL